MCSARAKVAGPDGDARPTTRAGTSRQGCRRGSASSAGPVSCARAPGGDGVHQLLRRFAELECESLVTRLCAKHRVVVEAIERAEQGSRLRRRRLRLQLREVFPVGARAVVCDPTALLQRREHGEMKLLERLDVLTLPDTFFGAREVRVR